MIPLEESKMNARRTAAVLHSPIPRSLSSVCPCGQLFTVRRLWYLTTYETIFAHSRVLFGAPACVAAIGNHLLCHSIRCGEPEWIKPSQCLVRSELQCQWHTYRWGHGILLRNSYFPSSDSNEWHRKRGGT